MPTTFIKIFMNGFNSLFLATSMEDSEQIIWKKLKCVRLGPNI
jgi:hypothetical protein